LNFNSLAIQPNITFAYHHTAEEIEKLKFSYTQFNCDVPLLVRYNLSPQLFLMVGPETHFNFYSKKKLKGDKSENIKEKNAFMEFGLTFGAAVSIIKNIDLDFRYFLGITEPIKNEKFLLQYYS
jgi:hypothetical protein